MKNPLLRRKQTRPGIVKNGLALWLDGRDFSNNPATSLWYDRAKPNAIPYANLVTNGDLSNGATGWTPSGASNAVSGNVLSNTGNGAINSPIAYTDIIATSYVANTKYYLTALVKVTNSACSSIRFNIVGTNSPTQYTFNSPVQNQQYKLSCILTMPASGTNAKAYIYHYYVDSATANGKVMQVQQVMAIDLTAIFGAGNEPTQEECDRIFSFVPTTGTTYRGNNATPSNFGYIAPYADILSDFAGKVRGSVVENPNIAKYAVQDSLQIPSSGNFSEFIGTTSYDNIYANTDGKIGQLTNTTNGIIPQQLFSFDLISIFERKYGEIPSTDKTTTEKVAWLKNNISKLSFDWHGYGSCPSGNVSNLKACAKSGDWYFTRNHASPFPSVLTIINSDMNNYICTDGFAYFLAYTDASDGVTASTIYTDYVSLTMSFKAASGSDNKGGVVFDGVDDSISIPNSSAFIQMYKNGVAITPTGTINTAGTYKNIVAYNRVLTDTEVARNLSALK